MQPPHDAAPGLDGYSGVDTHIRWQHTPEQAHQAGILVAGLRLGSQAASQGSCEVAAKLWVGDSHREG